MKIKTVENKVFQGL